MADYIKRSDAMTICEGYSQHCFETSDSRGQDIADRILDDVEELPTADVEEVKHGEWIDDIRELDSPAGVTQKYLVGYKCSLCGRSERIKEPYCNCGAKMDGGNKNGLYGLFIF
ncbi:MAG: hypothetical protein IJM94_06675 [Clostridia bacterium]|nr:hypothetical protein [Clostridia bacterium]